MNTNPKQSLDALLDTLADKLEQGGHNLLPMLGLMSRFTRYSLSNQLLIYLQRPNASKVLGFHSWRKAGYVVRKGEKGIAIYAPMRLRNDADDIATDANAIRLRFRVAYVFDISQVEHLKDAGSAVPDIPANIAPPAPLACLDSLKLFLVSEGIALVYQELAPGHYGMTDGKTITCSTGQSPHIEFATLVHEAAHTLLHFNGDQPDLSTRETEAEAVTYLLCEQLGLADTQLSIDYIRAYRGTKYTLMGSLERIRATAQRLAEVLIPEAAN
jgi:antirestriction protein ArdC